MQPKTFDEWYQMHYNINAGDVYFFKLELFLLLNDPESYYNNIIYCDDFSTYFSIAVMDIKR
ncbi:hypothetical protein PBI_121Q_114 [Escherichia phage 121Q]|uniref:Uncharacterized protein n=1 Tax=Escherichia phage 121Q TaxID=1555202 RepID=A0A097EX78_9CAUD|nr:hypothetical protein PBI_121Q_114 [Escherichia phage 121Q]AIT14011.1 hypothetical protein PBI_121Q_114 [Escherichia phage 121Q]